MNEYRVVEAALADTQRLLTYRINSTLDIHLNIKGFNYAWIIDSIQSKPGCRILDVGAGYSRLPSFLAQNHACEVWAVDDFGYSEKGSFWERNQDPQQFIDDHPEVHYVIGRIGDENLNQLPHGYFDFIISASALEHVPPGDIGKVWSHMDQLLKPGGVMLHGLDIAFPTNLGWQHVALAVLFDFFYPFIPPSLKQRFVYETPKSYVRYISRILKLTEKGRLRGLSVINMVLNPEIVVEPLEHTFHRMVKDDQLTARYFRMGSLLLHLKKRE
jgi:2-polyprenyl-3-methyl-5-hydroxy-6-metoxy-1,4-benzoquinol methylase